MPVSTSSRSSAAYIASATTTTPSRSHLPQPMSPSSTSSYTPTVTSVGQVLRMNVVSRIAIEGKAKQGQDGASVKMYMKLSIPVDSVTPGSTIALFPEENVKILTSQIHPLDSNSVPYNFSSAGSPLLHNAARALGLPARLAVTFNAAFRLSSSPNITASTTSTNQSSESESVVPPTDPQYTGQILVSGYHITYVLPRYFPSRDRARSESESDRLGHSHHQKRRLSIGDRNHAHFMAAVDMWVPYVTRPPRFPYLLSIPTPRCLHNNIRLRIFPPSSTASSFASLSSLEDDANSWDLTSDPHVTRTSSNRLARTSSYNHFADDESSDSSTTGFSDGFGIQGTFPSTDRIRVRWAKPMKSFDGGGGVGDPRRKVGVKEVKSEMTCIIRGKNRGREDGGAQGIVVDIEYKASCKGIWFPGVATLLGMDVGLVTKNSDVTWLEGLQPEWSVSGGVGYTGSNAGAECPDTHPPSRISSIGSPSPQVLISPSGNSQAPPPDGKSRPGSSSTSSLLRAPLPSQNIAEYSFESSNDPAVLATSHLGTLSSSISYLSQSNITYPPGAPLTLHLNINDILPPNKTPFAFAIKGTILVTPRTTLSRVSGIYPLPLSDYETIEPINVPHFTVLAADAETTKIVVQNEVDRLNATVEVYSPSGDIHRDPQVRKTVLQKGGWTRCGKDGGRIVLKVIGHPPDDLSPGFAQALTFGPKSRAPRSTTRSLNTIHQIRDGPPLIPSAKAIVTPLVSRHRPAPDAYAVRIYLNVPVKNETDWLEFGLARVSPSSSRTPLPDSGETRSPIVHIAGASVDGVPVQYAITNTERQPLVGKTLPGASFETVDNTDWVIWVKILVGPSSGDSVVIDYVVKFEPVKSSWFSSWNNWQRWNLLLPTFGLPIGRLEISLESLAGFTCSITNSNLAHQHSNPDRQRLLHFARGELFTPRVSLEFQPVKSNQLLQRSWLATVLLWCCCTLVTILLIQKSNHYILPTQVFPTGSSIQATTFIMGDHQDLVTTTVTTTSTVADCPFSTRHLVEWTASYVPNLTPSESMAPTPLSVRAASTVAPSLLPTDPIPPLTAIPSQHSLSPYSIASLTERLGLNGLEASLRSIAIPDLQFSSAKEKLARFGGTIWGWILSAYYYPESRSDS